MVVLYEARGEFLSCFKWLARTSRVCPQCWPQNCGYFLLLCISSPDSTPWVGIELFNETIRQHITVSEFARHTNAPIVRPAFHPAEDSTSNISTDLIT